MKKAKGPPNLPERGDKCKMRGRKNNGVLWTIDDDSLWSKVIWEFPPGGPTYCHLYELEKMIPIEKDNERFKFLSIEPKAVLPDVYTAPLDIRSTTQLINERLSNNQ